MTTPPPPRAIIALDLLRFACALLVVAFHYGTAFVQAPGGASDAVLDGLPMDGRAIGTTWFGWVGVELFFVLSGFVITLSAEGTGTVAFLRRRALRLVPAAWICASATALVLLVAAPDEGLLHRWIISMTFWPHDLGIDPAYWTLGIELFFYVLIATGLGGGGTLAAIERRALLVGTASTAFWLFATGAGPSVAALAEYRTPQLLLLPHGCYFALGVTAYAALTRGMTRRRVAMIIVWTATALVEIAARTAVFAGTLALTLDPLVPMLLFLAGLAAVLTCLRVQPFLARHVDGKLASTLGLMTYPLYLIHQEAGAVVTAAAIRAGLPYVAAVGVALATALAFAWWVAVIAEPALRAVLARVFSLPHALRRDTRPSASPPAG